jgi:hypothetical protein
VNTTSATGLVILALAGGFAAGWLVRAPDADVRARAESAEARVKELEEVHTQDVAEKAERSTRARLEADAAASRSSASAPRAAGSSPATPAPAEAGTASPPDKAASKAPRLGVTGREKALEAVDWGTVGENAHAMVPLIGDLVGAIAKGESPSVELMGKVQQRNGPLLSAAGAYARAVGAGDDPNAAFTEPAFGLNLIASTLAAAGLALSEAQATTLRETAARIAEEDVRRRATYREETFALQRLLDDSESRDRWYRAVFAALTPEQAAALRTPEVTDRAMADLFSAALMWTGHVRLAPFVDREALLAQAESFLATTVHATDAAAARRAATAWVDSWPAESLATVADHLTQMQMVRLSAIHEGARRTLFLLQRWIDEARLDEAAARPVRAVATALVPVRTAAPR